MSLFIIRNFLKARKAALLMPNVLSLSLSLMLHSRMVTLGDNNLVLVARRLLVILIDYEMFLYLYTTLNHLVLVLSLKVLAHTFFFDLKTRQIPRMDFVFCFCPCTGFPIYSYYFWCCFVLVQLICRIWQCVSLPIRSWFRYRQKILTKLGHVCCSHVAITFRNGCGLFNEWWWKSNYHWCFRQLLITFLGVRSCSRDGILSHLWAIG